MGIYRTNGDSEKKKFLDETFKLRAMKIKKNLLKHKPTIVCLQEVSKQLFDLIYDEEFKRVYPYSYEEKFSDNFDSIIKKRDSNRDKVIEVHIFSQIPANEVKLYKVKGNLDYSNSLIMADFGKFIVLNSYLQAGSKKSPGQQKVWYHYSRCRQDEFIKIMEIIEKYHKPAILVGDFNCHLDGPLKEWNELKALKLKTFNPKDFIFIDSWRELESDPLKGFTEDTNINNMRWNSKSIEKN